MAEKYIRTSLLFEHLVDDPAWMPYFLDFLSRHEQSHLLLFWLEVEVFELAAGGGPSLVTQATRIHNSYLGADAPKRIDLPTGMQAFIQDEVAGGAPNINVFGAAHAWVYRRLKQTWYPAFLMSSTYQALLEHLKKSFTIPLRDLLVDEVQSRYLEAFLLNCDARFPPAAIGNVYLWKKIYKDLRPLGSRLARGRPGDARDAEDIKLFISDAHATYEAYIHPPPPSSSTGSSSGGATPRGAATAPPTATALPGDLRQRIAECLGRLVGQSRYFAASFPAHAGALAGTQLAAAERTLLGELTGHLMEAQRVVFAWLDQEVYPLFLRSWLCGVLSGDVQARRSHPLRRKRRLRTLFKSVRPFRHVYVPPCPRSEGRGLVLVCTEGVTPPPPPLGQELVWAFDVAVFPARRPAPMTAAELRADAVDEEEEEDGEEEELGSGPTPLVAAQAAADDEEEDDEAGGLLDDEGEDDYAVEGQILSSKGRGADDGDDAGVFKLEGAAKGGKRGRGGSKKPRPLRFRSAVRAWQGVAAPLLPPGEGEEEGVKKDDADDATALSPGLTARLAEEVQRLALPALCLMPLERSTFVLFSPKLLLPDPAFHHFVLPVARRAVDARLRPTSNTTTTTPSCPFPKSPRVAVVSPRGEALEAPDLVADDHVLLYGCTLVEWAPAGDEALLPRCLTLVSTEPRFESLRGALLAMRGAQAAVMPMTPQGSSPLTPGTPKKTPWQLEDEKQQRARKAEAGAGAGVEAPSMALLEAAVLDERRSHAGRPASAEAARYWRRAAQGYGHAAVAAFTLGGTGVGGGAGGGGGGGFGGNALLFPTAGAGAASLPLTMTGGGGGGAPAVAAATGMGNSDNNASSSSSTPRLPPPLLRALPAPVDASYVPLFRALSPETLLQALTAVLLERPVVVQSSSRTLAALACEALRRLVHPFAWLRPYMPLLPVAGVCAFWDEVKRSGGGQTWYDYVFEDDGLDDSLAPATGEAYVEPATTSAAALRLVPGFLVGLESCIADAALSAPRVLSPAYSDTACHAWACAGTCEVHPDGGGGDAPLSPLDSPFAGPLSTRTPRTDAALQAATSARAAGRANSTTKYGELPLCVRASARALLASAVVVDLDRDNVTEPRRGDPSTALPPLPDGAAAALLASVQRIVNPTLEGAEAGGYGYRVVQAARRATVAASAAAAASSRGGGSGKKKWGESKRGATPPPPPPPPSKAVDESVHPNQLLHGAFVGFFREVLLDRYREYTLSYLEEQMVAFHADAFLASQPEASHAFWAEFFQTRLFAHFLLLEHRRVADTFEAPPPLAPPRPGAGAV